MISCACAEPHESKRIVMTGGPGAGKTAVLELIRQSFCVHVRVLGGGYDRTNPLRRESAAEAAAIDARIAGEWDGHPRRFFVEAASDFLEKGKRALAILRAEMPECCRNHIVPTLDR